MKILSAEQIRKWDQFTILNEPVSSIDLMERAAGECRKWVQEKMLEQEHTISPDDLNLFRLVDTAEEATEHIFRFYEKYVLKPNF